MSLRAVQQRLISQIRGSFHHKCMDAIPEMDRLHDARRRTTDAVRGSARGVRLGPPIEYKLPRLRLRISFTQLDQNNPKVLFALGSEIRGFKLQEFVDFWLAMVKVGRAAVDAHLTLTGSSAPSKKNRTPMIFGLKRRALQIMFTDLERKKLKIFVALGHEVREFRFEEFIDLWLDMVDLVPKVVQVHSIYVDELAKQSRESSRGGHRTCTVV